MKFSIFPLVSRVFLIVSWSSFIATTLESLIIPTSLSSQHWDPLFFPSHSQILLVILVMTNFGLYSGHFDYYKTMI